MDTKPPLWLFWSASPQFACLFRSNALIAKLCHTVTQMENAALKPICVFESCFGIKHVREHEYLIWARTAAHPAGKKTLFHKHKKLPTLFITNTIL